MVIGAHQRGVDVEEVSTSKRCRRPPRPQGGPGASWGPMGPMGPMGSHEAPGAPWGLGGRRHLLGDVDTSSTSTSKSAQIIKNGTKWVAIPPFLTFGPASDVEFRAGAIGMLPGLKNPRKNRQIREKMNKSDFCYFCLPIPFPVSPVRR